MAWWSISQRVFAASLHFIDEATCFINDLNFITNAYNFFFEYPVQQKSKKATEKELIMK